MRMFRAAILGALVGLSLGCESETPQLDMGGEDGQQIASLIDSLNDDSHSRAKMKAAFAADQKLSAKQSAAYAQYQYGLKGKPAVSGTTATCTVVLTKQSGGDGVEKEWGFVKEGDKWKIKSAPLL